MPLQNPSSRSSKACRHICRSKSAVAAIMSKAQVELDALPPTPFLHDTTTKNVIVTPAGSFSGIVDVDDLCFGDPRYAVALTSAALLAHRSLS